MKKIKKLFSVVLTICVVLSNSLYTYSNTLDIVESIESSEVLNTEMINDDIESETNIDIIETETTVDLSYDDISEESLIDEICEIVPCEDFSEDFEYEDEPEYDIVESEDLLIDKNILEDDIEETMLEIVEDTPEVLSNINEIIEEESEIFSETTNIDNFIDYKIVETENLTSDFSNEISNNIYENDLYNETQESIEDLSTELTFNKSNLYGASNKIKSIKAINSFNKTTYNYGDKIDLSGLSIEVLYEDGTKNNITYSDENSDCFKIYVNLIGESDIARDCSVLIIRYDPDKNFFIGDSWSVIDFGAERAKIDINNIPDFESGNLPTFKIGFAGSIDEGKAKWEIGKSLKENLKKAWPVILYSYEQSDPKYINDWAYAYHLFAFGCDDKLNPIGYPAIHHFGGVNKIVEADGFYTIYFAIKNVFFCISAKVDSKGLTYFTLNNSDKGIKNKLKLSNPMKAKLNNYSVGDVFNPDNLEIILETKDSYLPLLYSYNEFSEDFSFEPSAGHIFTNEDKKIIINFLDLSYELDIEMIPKCKIDYDLAGGKWVAGFTPPTERKNNATTTLPGESNIKREGYKFKGWINSSDNSIINEVAYYVNSDVRVLASWEEDKQEETTPPVKTVTNVSIFTNPKTVYTEDEYFNPENLVLNVSYSDMSNEQINYNNITKNDFSFVPNLNTKLNKDNTNIKIKYKDLNEVVLNITVNTKPQETEPETEIETERETEPETQKETSPATPQNNPPTYNGGGGRSGGSGGRGGGGGGGGAAKAGSANNGLFPFSTNQAVQTTNVIHYRNLSNQVNGNASAFTKDETNSKWKLNYIGTNGQILSAKSGFFTIKKAVSQVVNNVPTWVNEESTYYFDDANYMITGFVKTPDNKTYYFEHEKNANEGKMITGWKQIQGSWYYFNVDGSMLINSTTPDGYKVGADGKFIA